LGASRTTVPLSKLVSYLSRGVSPLYTEATEGLLVVNQKCIRDHRLSFGEARRTDTLRKAVSEDKQLKIFDVVVNSTGVGTLGRVAQVRALNEPATVDSHVTIVRAEPSKVDPRYLGVAMRVLQPQIEAMAEGTTGQTELSRAQLGNLQIPLLTCVEQVRTADIVFALDDKIELNRRMAATLEEMARALFKSWFVDFDPVRAKAEGRPTGLPRDIDALFPDELVESELGLIPKGWRTGVLSDALCELEVGGRPKGGVAAYKHGIPSIGAESIVGLGIFEFSKTKFIPQEFFEKMKKGHLKSRDVLLYKDGGRPGEFEPHVTLFGNGFPYDVAAINEHVYRLRAKPQLGQDYLFFWLSSRFVMDEMRNKGTGVAIPGLNSTQVRSLSFLYPNDEVIEVFDRLVEPQVSRVLELSKESRNLGLVRDALLPKLISGEIKVSEMEIFAEGMQL
jgi:type I restriction enzyme S subunit